MAISVEWFSQKPLLRPVAQLYGQVRMDWNQCIVIDCSVSLPAGHKPFTRPDCVRVYHVTYQLRLLLNAFFCLPRCVRIYDTVEFCRRPFFVFLNSGCAASVPINRQINRPFSAIRRCFCHGKNKSPLVSGVGNHCRCAWLNVTPNSRAINCIVTSQPLPAPCLKQPQAGVTLSPSPNLFIVLFIYLFASRYEVHSTNTHALQNTGWYKQTKQNVV